jgi:hypothetical protein
MVSATSGVPAAGDDLPGGLDPVQLGQLQIDEHYVVLVLASQRDGLVPVAAASVSSIPGLARSSATRPSSPRPRWPARCLRHLMVPGTSSAPTAMMDLRTPHDRPFRSPSSHQDGGGECPVGTGQLSRAGRELPAVRFGTAARVLTGACCLVASDPGIRAGKERAVMAAGSVSRQLHAARTVRERWLAGVADQRDLVRKWVTWPTPSRSPLR